MSYTWLRVLTLLSHISPPPLEYPTCIRSTTLSIERQKRVVIASRARTRILRTLVWLLTRLNRYKWLVYRRQVVRCTLCVVYYIIIYELGTDNRARLSLNRVSSGQPNTVQQNMTMRSSSFYYYCIPEYILKYIQSFMSFRSLRVFITP